MAQPKKQKLDAYLAEVFKQFISIKDDDFKRAQEVFKNVFSQVTQKMGEQCSYFQKYSRQVLYAGSVYDGIKVAHMDEFDMDIVIKLPINYEEITLENDQPGFLRLKITSAFDNLDKQQHWENCHKVTRDWRDSDKYLLQNKFRHWLHGIVSKAMNKLKNQVDVNGTVYLVTYKESGPAYTLQIRNDKGDEQFQLDVDLVPVIRFQQPRWPEGYNSRGGLKGTSKYLVTYKESGVAYTLQIRNDKGDEQFQLDVDLVPVIRFQQPRWPEGYETIQGTQMRDWLVVPKPNKAIQDGALKNRCWRLSFQDYEREMMMGSEALKTTIRLLKKLRDGLELKSIASYYIKTLFLWEISQASDKSYWRNKISVTFRGMVEKLYLAIKDRKIMYFWHPDNNLIESMRPTLLHTYELKLKEVLDAIEANDCEKVVGYLLTTNELAKFKSSEFYVRVSAVATPNLSKQISVTSENSPKGSQSPDSGLISESVRALNDEIDSVRGEFHSQEKMAQIVKTLAYIEDRVKRLEMKVKKMEMEKELAEVFCGVSASVTSPEEPLIHYE